MPADTTTNARPPSNDAPGADDLLAEINRMQEKAAAHDKPLPTPPAASEDVDIARLWRRAKVWAMLVLSGFLYFTVISQGYRSLLPDVARIKLCDLPFRRPWNALEVGHLLALVTMAAVYANFTRNLRVLLFADAGHDRSVVNLRADKAVLHSVGVFFLFLEPCLFYFGLCGSSLWGRGAPPFVLVLFSIAWLAVVVTVTYWKVLNEERE